MEHSTQELSVGHASESMDDGDVTLNESDYCLLSIARLNDLAVVELAEGRSAEANRILMDAMARLRNMCGSNFEEKDNPSEFTYREACSSLDESGVASSFVFVPVPTPEDSIKEDDGLMSSAILLFKSDFPFNETTTAAVILYHIGLTYQLRTPTDRFTEAAISFYEHALTLVGTEVSGRAAMLIWVVQYNLYTCYESRLCDRETSAEYLSRLRTIPGDIRRFEDDNNLRTCLLFAEIQLRNCITARSA